MYFPIHQAKTLIAGIVCLATSWSIPAIAGAQDSPAANPSLAIVAKDDPGAVFDEVAALVAEHFFDPAFDQTEWSRQAAQFRPRAVDAAAGDGFAAAVNQLLETLETSHTRYFSKRDPRRYQLLGVFHELFDGDPDDLFIYQGVGIETELLDGKLFVSAVYDGLPAAMAGIQFGDEPVSVDGQPFHPIDSFLGKAGRIVEFQIRRRGEVVSCPVNVERLDGRTMFESAMQSSIRVIQRNERRIGYVHVWSYAGMKYQEKLRSAILWGELASCDSLILDLRDGWGGADVNYLNLFRPPIVDIKTSSRTLPGQNYTGVWGKPVALITNSGSTSGKELFSFGFQKLKLGRIFGEPTAGAVVGGRCFLLSNGDVLYLAVSDVTVDGIRLEGRGVTPDSVVSRPLNQADGSDSQLDAALEFLAR